MATAILKKKLVKSIDFIEDENFLRALQVIVDDRIKDEVQFNITEQQRKILRSRLASIDNGTATLVPWSEVKSKIKRALQDSTSK